MKRLEVQPLELIVAAGQVDHPDFGVPGFGLQDLSDRGDVFDAAHVGDEPSTGTKLLESELNDTPHLPAGAADKNRVGRRQTGPSFRRFSQDGRQIANAKTLGV